MKEGKETNERYIIRVHKLVRIARTHNKKGLVVMLSKRIQRAVQFRHLAHLRLLWKNDAVLQPGVNLVSPA